MALNPGEPFLDLGLADLALMIENPTTAYGREPAHFIETRREGSRDMGMRGSGSITTPASPYMGFSILNGRNVGPNYRL